MTVSCGVIWGVFVSCFPCSRWKTLSVWDFVAVKCVWRLLEKQLRRREDTPDAWNWLSLSNSPFTDQSSDDSGVMRETFIHCTSRRWCDGGDNKDDKQILSFSPLTLELYSLVIKQGVDKTHTLILHPISNLLHSLVKNERQEKWTNRTNNKYLLSCDRDAWMVIVVISCDSWFCFTLVEKDTQGTLLSALLPNTFIKWHEMARSQFVSRDKESNCRERKSGKIFPDAREVLTMEACSKQPRLKFSSKGRID